MSSPVASRRDLVIVASAVFVVSYGTNVSTPFLVLYRERLELGDSATMAIFTVYVVGILGALVVSGPLSDRIGRRAVCVPFVALSGVASLLLIPGRDEFVLLLIGRLLLGIVSGAVLGVGAAWLQELTGPDHRQRAAVLTTVITYAGFGAGPPVSALFERFTDSPLVLPFLVHAAMALGTAALLMRSRETVGSIPGRAVRRIEFGVPTAHRREFWSVVVPAAVWVFSFPSTSFALFPVLVSDSIQGSEVLVAAGAGMITAWSALLARPTLRRFGPRRSLPLGLGAGTLGYVLGATAFGLDQWALVLPAALLLGGASGAISAGVLALLASMADDDTRGALNSTFYLLAYPGMAMPILITGLASVVTLTASLAAVTALASATTVFALRTSRPGRPGSSTRLSVDRSRSR